MSAIASQFSEGIIPQPGIYRNNTPYYSGFRWVDGDKVRFSSDVPEKIGGWQREIYSGTILGVPRSFRAWSSLDSTKLKAVGTHLFVYAISGGVSANITPYRESNALTNCISTVDTETTVTIEDAGARSEVRPGDWVRFGTPVTYNGVTLSGDYEVKTVDAPNDVYTITASTPANATGTGGGAVTIDYYVEAGLADSGVVGYGYGVGPYGEEEYGTARTTGITAEARLWCLQNFGEDLLMLPRGGALYFWDASVGTGTNGTKVTTAPEKNNFMIVGSAFRHAILFGTETLGGDFDPMLIRWPDIESYSDFTPSLTNSAGEYRLTEGSAIVGAVETKSGEILVLTDIAAYRMRPTSDNTIYEIRKVGSSCGLLSPFAMAEIDGVVYWMSVSSFKKYNGSVSTLDSSVEDFIFDPRSPGVYNAEQKVKFYAALNSDFNEIWFFWATNDSVEINRYSIFNYGNNSWYDGTLQRTCWVDKAQGGKPLAFDRPATLYIHEQGKNDDASAMSSYIRLGEVDIENGDMISLCDSFMPDGTFVGEMELTLYGKKRPNSSFVSSKDYTFLSTDDYVPVRCRGRTLSARFLSNAINGDYKLGKVKFSLKPDGRR